MDLKVVVQTSPTKRIKKDQKGNTNPARNHTRQKPRRKVKWTHTKERRTRGQSYRINSAVCPCKLSTEKGNGKMARKSQHAAFSSLFASAHTLSSLDCLSEMHITTNSCLDHIPPSTNGSIVCVHEWVRVEDEKSMQTTLMLLQKE